MNELHLRLPPPLLRAVEPDRLAGIAAMLLTVLVAYSAARLVWQLVPGGTPGGNQVNTGYVSPAPVIEPSADLAAAVARVNALELFGPLDLRPVDDGSNAPETRLDLKLRGVIATGVTATSRAFIAPSGGEERGYAIGAVLPGGAKLHAVLPDRVILERNGQLETLSLPRDELGDGTRRSTAAVSSADVRAVAEGNPQRLLDVVRPVAATDSNTGRMLGYRVYPGRDAERFGRLGLQPGDLIVSVNGVSLDDPARGLEILKSLTSTDAVMLTVERDGQQRLVQVPVTR